MGVSLLDPCPCGAGDVFGACCMTAHTGERQPERAEELMRARYSAFAAGDDEYLWRTWHPRTRPQHVTPVDGVVWTGLEIVDVVAGEPGDDVGEVEFRAHHLTNGRAGVLHERSRFAVRAGRWFYVDGDVSD